MSRKQSIKKKKKSSNGKQIIIVAAVVLALVIFFKLITSGGEAAVGLANQGIDLLKKEDFYESEKKFSAALKKDGTAGFALQSENPGLAFIGLGNLALENRSLTTASQYYRQAYKADKNADFKTYARFAREDKFYPEDAYINLGNTFYNSGMYPLARIAYERPLVENPGFKSALTNLGNIERKLGNIDEAISYYNRALASDPSALEARANLLTLANAEGQNDIFMFNLEKMEQYHPDNPLTKYFLGLGAIKRKQYDEALQYFKMYTGANPDNVQAQIDLATCYLELNDYNSAQVILEELALQYGPLPQIYARALRTAEEAYQAEDFVAARDFYVSMSAIWPDDPEFQFGAANCMIRLDQLEEARSILEDLIQRFPESPEVLTNLGLVYARMGKYEWAKEQFEQAILLDSSAVAYFNMGKVFEAEGDTFKANSYYMTAAIKEPDWFGMKDYMMQLKMETEEKIARGDTSGLIFIDRDE